MASVTVSVGGRAYQLGCEDGQEKRLTALANRIDAEVKRLSAATGPVGEARLLLMTALLLADQLDEARAETARAGAAADPAELAALDGALARLEAALNAGSRA
jgi:cell division protein ZapA